MLTLCDIIITRLYKLTVCEQTTRQAAVALFGSEVSISGTPQDEEQTSHMTDTFATEIILSINLNKYRCRILLQSYYYIIMLCTYKVRSDGKVYAFDIINFIKTTQSVECLFGLPVKLFILGRERGGG